jgi:hypothetical protein
LAEAGLENCLQKESIKAQPMDITTIAKITDFVFVSLTEDLIANTQVQVQPMITTPPITSNKPTINTTIFVPPKPLTL